MSEYTTISVTRETRDALDDSLPQGDSWNQRLQKALDEEWDHDELANRIDRLEGSIEELRETIQRELAEELASEKLIRAKTERIRSELRALESEE